MQNAYFQIPKPNNEPIRLYAPQSRERAELKAELAAQAARKITIPLIIGGEEVYTDTRAPVTMPHDHGHVLAECCMAGETELKMAVRAALAAKKDWEAMPWEHRAAIFLKAAELLSGPYRDQMNAATMLGQSKTVYQAEIDAVCELVDFLRFNTYYAAQIFKEQPENSPGVWNREVYRALDGFVVAITPFNFTSIGGNLGTAPAIVGNTVLWKPSTTAVLSNYYFMRILTEAGLPAGVVNFVPSRGADIGSYVLSHPKLAGCHFTGSTAVFQTIWAQVGQSIQRYASYPRLVGETGGKDFVFAHASAQVDPLVAALVRGAFEYQGQKCSAASRAYIPASLWPAVQSKLLAAIHDLKVGDIRDFTNFMGAVIDATSFANIVAYIEAAKASPAAEVLCGSYDGSRGYFVTPTVIRAFDPHYPSMTQEIFGPVLSVYVYPDGEFEQTLQLCEEASVYALTGAIFAQNRAVIIQMEQALRHAAGNFYINDKPTGAVVGQQPFGGARASGTNDKAGSAVNLYRWLSMQSIKESFVPSAAIAYPFMQEE